MQIDTQCPSDLSPQQIVDRIRKFGELSFSGLVAAIAGDGERAGAWMLCVPWEVFYEQVGTALAVSGKNIHDLEAAVKDRLGDA